MSEEAPKSVLPALADVFAFATLAALSGQLALSLLTGKEFVSALSWLISVYLLGKPAALLAEGWTTQAVAKAKAQ